MKIKKSTQNRLHWNMMKQRAKEMQEMITRGKAGKVGTLSDEDLASVRQAIEKEQRHEKNFNIELNPLVIKTLHSSTIIELIERRQSELKQLRIELIARIL